MSRNPDKDNTISNKAVCESNLFTSRIITDGVLCYDRSIRLRKVVLKVLVNYELPNHFFAVYDIQAF